MLQLTSCQNRVYAYILSLLPDPERAHDVLQETNLLAWRKADQFKQGTNFCAWACKIAFYEVLAERRRRHRDRHVFDESVLTVIASQLDKKLGNHDDRAAALEECLERLQPRQREQLLERYGPGGTVRGIAESTGKSRSAVAATLYRIRHALLDCVQSRLAEGGQA